MSESAEDASEQVHGIRKMDLSLLGDHPFIVLVGTRRAGKTHLAKHIYYELCDRFDATYVMTKTGASGAWDFVATSKEKHIFRDDFSTSLQLIIECQERVREQKGKERMPRLCVILDDVVGHIGPKDSTLIDLSTQGRWLNVTVILLSQYYKSFGTEVRNNTDLLIAFSNLSKTTGEALFDETSFSADLDASDFRCMYRSVAQGYYTLAILRTSKAADVKERFFFMKAPEVNEEDERRRAAAKRLSRRRAAAATASTAGDCSVQ